MKPKIATSYAAAALVAGLLGICATPQAMAQSTGFYVYGGIGSTDKSASMQDANNATATGGAGQTTSFDDSSGESWRLGAGYRFHRHWGVEAAYARYGKMSHTATNIGIGSTVTTAKPEAWQIVGMGFLPIGGNFELFGKAGVAFTRTRTSATSTGLFPTIGAPAQGENDTVPVIGAGVNWHPARGWLLRAEVEHVSKFSYARVQDLRPTLGAFAQPGGDLKTSATTVAVSVGYRF